MKQLIVNADDFGYTPGVNRGIIEAFQRGIVTSTSLMANAQAFADAVALAKQHPGLEVGAHLNLVEGKPVAPLGQIPHLIGADGNFYPLPAFVLRLSRGGIPEEEIEREASAQIGRLLDAGIHPGHVDTHQHTHLHGKVAKAVARAAGQYGIHWIRRPFENYNPAGGSGSPVRRITAWGLSLLAGRFERRMASQGLQMPSFFTGFDLTGRWTAQALDATLGSLPEGTTELMCHPGICDDDLLKAPTKLKQQRQAEFALFADAQLRSGLRARGILLRGFQDILTATAPDAAGPMMAVASRAGD